MIPMQRNCIRLLTLRPERGVRFFFIIGDNLRILDVVFELIGELLRSSLKSKYGNYGCKKNFSDCV
jgi:hypothetical protein